MVKSKACDWSSRRGVGSCHQGHAGIAKGFQQLSLKGQKVLQHGVLVRTKTVSITVIGGLEPQERPWGHIVEFRILEERIKIYGLLNDSGEVVKCYGLKYASSRYAMD